MNPGSFQGRNPRTLPDSVSVIYGNVIRLTRIIHQSYCEVEYGRLRAGFGVGIVELRSQRTRPPTPESEFGDRKRRVVMASMRHEVRHSHRSAAEVGHIRPTCRQKNSDATSTHDDPRGDFRHQHPPRP